MERRIVRVGISPELAIQPLTVGWNTGERGTVICIKGLPDGAKYIGGVFEPTVIWLYFEHESFEPVDGECKIPPTLEVEFRRDFSNS